MLLGTGALSNGFGLFGGNASKVKRLETCLDHRGINITSVVAGVGNPTTLLSGAHAVDSAIKHSKLKQPQARAVIECVQKVNR